MDEKQRLTCLCIKCVVGYRYACMNLIGVAPTGGHANLDSRCRCRRPGVQSRHDCAFSILLVLPWVAYELVVWLLLSCVLYCTCSSRHLTTRA